MKKEVKEKIERNLAYVSYTTGQNFRLGRLVESAKTYTGKTPKGKYYIYNKQGIHEETPEGEIIYMTAREALTAAVYMKTALNYFFKADIRHIFKEVARKKL